MNALKRSVAVLLAAASLPVASAGAATIVIDDFAVPQFVSALPPRGQVSSSEVRAPQSIGGYREMRVVNNNRRSDGTSLEVENNIVDFNNASRTTGTGTITWNGIRSTGLGGLDVTDGGTNDALILEILFADAALDLTFSLVDTLGRTSTYNYLVAERVSDPSKLLLKFEDFTGAANLALVNSVSFRLTSRAQSVDASLDLVSFGSSLAPIPLPASGMLLGAAVLGIGMVRRRKAA